MNLPQFDNVITESNNTPSDDKGNDCFTNLSSKINKLYLIPFPSECFVPKFV